MPARRSDGSSSHTAARRAPTPAPPEPMAGVPTSQFAEISRPIGPTPVVAPQAIERGVVVFDVDGTILDSIGLISHVAAEVMARAFETPVEEARIHYLA